MNQKVVSPDQQRAAADYLGENYGISQRRIGRVMGRSRSTLRYRRTPRAGAPALTREIKRLARRHPRYGSRRVHAMLIRRGWMGNLKRVRRLWNELGLRRPLRLRGYPVKFSIQDKDLRQQQRPRRRAFPRTTART